MAQYIALAILILTCAIGIFKHFSRTAQYKRKLADEAQQKVNDGVDKSDTSSITDGFDRIGRV